VEPDDIVASVAGVGECDRDLHLARVVGDGTLLANRSRNAATPSLGRPRVGKTWTDPLCRMKPSGPSTNQ
jgi:hypothetical protein